MLRRRRRFDRSWLWLAPIAALVGVYGVYWKVVHDRALAIVEDEVAAWREAGYAVEWTRMTSGGFPFAIEAVFEEPEVIAPPGSDIARWDGARLRVGLRPWALNEIILEPEGLHSVSSPVYGVLDGEAAGLTIRIRSDALGLRALSAACGHAALVRHADGQTVVAARAVDLRIERAEDDPGFFSLIGEALDPEWEGGAEGEPERIAISLALSETDVLAQSRMLDARALAAWSSAGGRLRVADLRFDWGDSEIGAAGDLWLDDAGRLSGEVALDSVEPRRAFSHLVALNVLEPEPAMRLGVIADALATGEDKRARFQFDMREGQARVLGLPLGPTPELY